MAIKTVASSAVLGLLFASLVVIYLLIPANGLVLFLSVLIMLVSLIVGQSRRWRDIGAMAVFAALVSLVAAALLGRALFGGVGRIVVPALWAVALLGMFSWTQRNIMRVPPDRRVLVGNYYSGGVRLAEGPISPPLTPGVEYKLAEIPMYQLHSDVKVEKLNTRGRHNVDALELHAEYRVRDPQLILSGIPNRSQVEADIAKSMSKPIREARLDVVYWEKLIHRQMEEEMRDIARTVIFNNTTAQNAVEIYNNRDSLAELMHERLADAVRRWGIDLSALEIEKVDFNPDIAKGINKAGVREDETLMEKIKAEREATRIRVTGAAQAQAEAMRVAEMVKALKEAGVDLSPDSLRDIVLDAIHAAAEATIEMNTTRM